MLRVLPVWFRLPRLPLHCWGEESLSRITSVLGVLLFANECTTSQLRLSYERVLVEIDNTKEIPKSIKIQDNEGNELIQQVIHEWCP